MKENQGRLLSPRDYMEASDPLLRFLLQRNIWPLVVLAAVLLYDSVYAVWLPLLQGTFDQVLRDWPGLLRALVTTPLLLAYYSWQPHTIQRLYKEVESRSLDLSQNDVKQLSRLIQPLGYRVWLWLGILFGLYQEVSFYLSLSNEPTHWQNSNASIIVMDSLVTFVSFYAVFQMFVRQLIALFGINNFFRAISIDISPLHPDRVGGLKPLGQYIVTIGLGIGIIGFALGISLLRSRMELEELKTAFFINLVLYLLAAPFFLFASLREAHRLMLKAKRAILLDVANQYVSVFQKSLVNMKAGNPIDKDLSQLDSIRKIYTIADGAPEWPFNLNMLSKFSAAIVLPVILPIIIGYLSNLIKSLLNL